MAPKCMLTMHKWRKNKDGSMSSLVTGSELFEHVLSFLVCRCFLVEKSSGTVPSFLNFGGASSISNSDSSSSQTTASLAQMKKISIEEARKTKTTTSR